LNQVAHLVNPVATMNVDIPLHILHLHKAAVLSDQTPKQQYICNRSFLNIAVMPFWRKTSFAEPIFQADDDNTTLNPQQPSTPPISRSSSSCSSSGASTCLAEDPLHERSVSNSKVFDHVILDSLYIGDVTIDEEGVEWVVRQCFCEVADCSGKTLKRLNSKTELDAWDRGRTVA
jgi:hypothetical protein